MGNIDFKVLDCTIRDGGHLLKWNFEPSMVRSAYYAAYKSGVDYFEIGYRNHVEDPGVGRFAKCEDGLLIELLEKDLSCKLTVMMDVGKSHPDLFANRHAGEATLVQAVRVAAYPYELEKAIEFVESLHSKGYEVFLNLMASSELSQDHYKVLHDWDNKNILNAIYFADSFGSFVPEDIPQKINDLKMLGFSSIGFHPHNNLQLAFANTIAAVNAGATWVDASIYGMGRGCGNLPIEILIGYLEKRGYTKYNTVPYLDVISRFFLDLYREIGWGYSLESLMGGLADIHPYYVKALTSNGLYTVDEIWNAMKVIKEKCPVSFSRELLEETLQERFYYPVNHEQAGSVLKKLSGELQISPAPDAFVVERFPFEDGFKGRKFLVIATGPSALKNEKEINEFIRKNHCMTIGVNNLQGHYVPDFHLFVSKKRFQDYVGTISVSSRMIVPGFFGKDFVKRYYPGEVSYFNVETRCDPDALPVDGNRQCCAGLNVAVSAILLAYSMGASEIYVVGMDGYIDENNKIMVHFYNENNMIDDKDVARMRYEVLANELERVSDFLQSHSVPFCILTDTSHKKYYRPL